MAFEERLAELERRRRKALAVDHDDQTIDGLGRFLSQLPRHYREPLPRVPVPASSGADADRILDILPEASNKVYDVRWIIGSGFLIGKEGERLAVTGKVMRTWPTTH